MPTRIPLVTPAPADGKNYTYKDGTWVAQTAATTTSDGLFSKDDKAALDLLVAGGGTSSTKDNWIADVAGANILLDKDGNAITSKDGDVLHFGSVDGKEIIVSRSSTSGIPHIREFGHMDLSSGNWAQQTLSVGGMIFQWSSNTVNTGTLTHIRDMNCSRTSEGLSTSYACRYGTSNTVGYNNLTVWSNTLQTHNALGDNFFTAAYQRGNIMICTRSGFSACWMINMMTTGSNSLSINIEYTGPRYDYK